MRLLVIALFTLLLSHSVFAESVYLPDENQLKADLKAAEANKNIPNQAEVIETLQGTITALNERKTSQERSKQYKEVIDNFPVIMQELRKKLNENRKMLPDSNGLSTNELEQRVLQASSQLLEQSRQLQLEQEHSREISDSLNQLPRQQSEARRLLAEAQYRLQTPKNHNSSLDQLQMTLLQTEMAARKAKVDELDLAQLSASNRQELSRMLIDVYKKNYDHLDQQLQTLRNTLNNQRQREAEKALEQSELLAEQNSDLPNGIRYELETNRALSSALNQQAQRLENISSQQRETATQVTQVRQALNTIIEQSQWVSVSSALGETLRAQLSRLPEMPKPQRLDTDMAQLRVQRLQFEEQLDKLAQAPVVTQTDGQPLTTAQQRLLDAQRRSQRELLTSLISGCDTEILELTKLKVANNQLIDTLNEITIASHRYLFWVTDVPAVNLSYPVNVAHDLTRLLSIDTLAQMHGAVEMMFTNSDTLVPLFGALLLVIISISSRRHYHVFLERTAGKVGKVTQDRFSLTLYTAAGALLMALPLPVLWAILGYGLQNAWPYPVAVAIGDGVTATQPILWICMISAAFAHPRGLFIRHFGWDPKQVARAMRYYVLSIWVIVPLIMALIAFDRLNDREFDPTLGRLCFILLCIALSIVTKSLQRAGIPLYLNKQGSGNNLVNRVLWRILLFAPLFAGLASVVGYLTTAQALLARLETSVFIWFTLLVVYYIIRRWMLIQRRRIAFERAKQRRADILAQRARNGDELTHSSTEGAIEVEEPVVDLDEISAQSLRLVRSILTLIALLSVIALWSEIHSAFSFVENIKLWEVSTSVQGVETVLPITLGSVLIAILVLVITTQLVRNLPALLELILLQHLDLSPGTGYAITTISKYVLMLLGSVVGFAWIGLEWSKLQWLVAALSLGLGFGLQEIFANFISGLIILFEKPIRIGDTVTIRDLTGNITKIKTRATTISDWDRKEIIVPNKAFITEQFINWSLSDPITRVVLTVPAPAEVAPDIICDILLTAAKDCPLVLDVPEPEVYLVDLQQGIQIFELRLYAADMGHRMPMRHEVHQNILAGYQQQDIVLPYPPFQIKADIIGRTGSSKKQIMTSGAKKRTPGSL